MNNEAAGGRWVLVMAALVGALALVLSALSAHVFNAWVDAAELSRLDKANRYLTQYSLVLLAVGVLGQCKAWSGLGRVALFFTIGVGIFSGSLYILCLTEISWIARLTPLGGLVLLAGWLLLAWTGWRQGASTRLTTRGAQDD